MERNLAWRRYEQQKWDKGHSNMEINDSLQKKESWCFRCSSDTKSAGVYVFFLEQVLYVVIHRPSQSPKTVNVLMACSLYKRWLGRTDSQLRISHPS